MNIGFGIWSPPIPLIRPSIRMGNAIKLFVFVYPDGKRNETNVFMRIRMAHAIKPMLFLCLLGKTHKKQLFSLASYAKHNKSNGLRLRPMQNNVKPMVFSWPPMQNNVKPMLFSRPLIKTNIKPYFSLVPNQNQYETHVFSSTPKQNQCKTSAV